MGTRRFVHVQRPEPVIFVALHEEARAVLKHEMMRMIFVHAKHTMNLPVGILYAPEVDGRSIKFGEFRLGDDRPLTFRRGRHAQFPRAVAFEKPRQRKRSAVWPFDSRGKPNHERVRHRGVGSEAKIVRLPSRDLRRIRSRGRCHQGRDTEETCGLKEASQVFHNGDRSCWVDDGSLSHLAGFGKAGIFVIICE